MASRGAIGLATCVAGALAGALSFQLACGSSYEEDTGTPDAATSGSDAGAPDAPPPKCGDPGSQCVVVPSGWIVVSSATLEGDAGASACPPYFTENRILAENARSEGSCTCACVASSKNPCLGATVNMTIHNGGMNCNDGTTQVVLDGTCRSLGQTLPGQTSGVVTAPPPTGAVTCGAPMTTTPSRLVDGRVSVCTSPPPAPCGEGACVAAGSEVKTCVVREGEHECPAPYTNRKLVVDESGIVDSRQCAACTCVPKTTACTNPTLTIHQDTGCNDVGVATTPNGSCQELAGLGGAKAYRYSVAFDGGCAPDNATPPVKGELTLPAKQTLCCK